MKVGCTWKLRAHRSWKLMKVWVFNLDELDRNRINIITYSTSIPIRLALCRSILDKKTF
jgi:hypothetical protein